MTRKQIRSMWRNVRLAVVLGAMGYLIVGVSMIGNSQPQENKTVEVSSTLTTEVPKMIPTEIPTTVTTQAPTEEPKVSKYDFTSHESNLLCKIAMAEAGNQDTKGKALVMLVVLNRAYGNNEFPDTIEEVIYQPKQFSPVLEGKFESTEPDDDCYKAIELVQSGWDESQGALYFESKSKSTWHEDNLRFLFKHQDHYFYAERG
jgi:N-acetylmuramoyl-L-alanine amidase